LRGIEQDLQERAGFAGDDGVNVAGYEEEDYEEDGTSEDADADARDHNAGAFARCLGDFFNHVCDRVL
jgi:hypothetical protein